MSATVSQVFIVEGKEVSHKEYSEAFEIQNLMYGCAINRTSLIDNKTFVVELISYEKVWKQIGGPEPVSLNNGDEQ